MLTGEALDGINLSWDKDMDGLPGVMVMAGHPDSTSQNLVSLPFNTRQSHWKHNFWVMQQKGKEWGWEEQETAFLGIYDGAIRPPA